MGETKSPRVDRPAGSPFRHKAWLDESEIAREGTPYLYTHLRTLAVSAEVQRCRQLAEYLVKEREEKPNTQLYTALILSNISHDDGAAWRVRELLEEMLEAGVQLDVGSCHAVLKALAVHPDHLLRSDVLEYMRARWLAVNEEGAHDVAAGLLREGLFEQALERIDTMRREGARLQPWLLDMTVYVLCAAGEMEEAHRIMRRRHDSGELTMSRTLWYIVLDSGSTYRHHPSTAFVWNSQVNTGYIQVSAGMCLNVLTTAARAGDAVLATNVFKHLSKRGTSFQPIHYQLLLDCYVSNQPPDLKGALSILTIMTGEKIEPAATETRSLYLLLTENPALLDEAFHVLRDLHQQGRKIPIAALNLLIECHVHQRNLGEAMKVYKLIHTFVPISEGAKRTFANIETFNLLLRGCRVADPPDERMASFLVSELLTLRIKPTALTYDRLILVYLEAGMHAAAAAQKPGTSAARAQEQHTKGLELLDWAFRHFVDMQTVPASNPGGKAVRRPIRWLPRFGTFERLATVLATMGDERCWDVLQTGEDEGEDGVEGWAAKGKRVRHNVEKAWKQGRQAEEDNKKRASGVVGNRPPTAVDTQAAAALSA